MLGRRNKRHSQSEPAKFVLIAGFAVLNSNGWPDVLIELPEWLPEPSHP
jgi:hypothetical protein